MNVFDEVKKALRKVNPGLDDNKMVSSALLKDDLDIDSLDLVEVAMTLEDVFSLTLQEDEVDNIKTVGDIVSLIEARLKVRSA
ncbi:MAG: phosphopantetheine-binding protein [Chloroflexi bacterium]|jgi:acyl carrier protein|nr:phosphopantetheine-binding protein [Chloroflexota bacterium]